VSASACVTLHRPAFILPTPTQEWPGVLAIAQDSAGKNAFDAADSALAKFANRYPGTSEALETAYWRALYKMDPSNRASSMPQAMAGFDRYLADSRAKRHMSEATTLRRVAAQIDGLNKLAANAMAQTNAANANAANARAIAADARADAAKTAADATGTSSADAEIKRLKDELAKANAELERIRKRLAPPPPQPPKAP
jgi:hypothetical protein